MTQPGYSVQLEKRLVARSISRKLIYLNGAMLSSAGSDTEHKHSWIVACINILKRTTRDMRKMVPGVIFITSENEQSEQKVN